MILITAANGHLGQEIVAALLKKTKASELVAAARNPEKLTETAAQGIKCRMADYDEPDSLNAAFRGIKTLILIPSRAPKDQRIQQHRNAIREAENASVDTIVFVSFIDAREHSPLTYAQIFADTEKVLSQSSLSWTIVRMPLYTDSMLEWLPKSLETGVLSESAGDGQMNFLTRADLAESIAVVATEGGHAGKTYELTGPEALSNYDLVDLASEIYEKPMFYDDLSPDEYYQHLKKRGMPEYLVEGAVGMAAAAKEGTFERITDHVQALTGHPPESVKSFLQRHPL